MVKNKTAVTSIAMKTSCLIACFHVLASLTVVFCSAEDEKEESPIYFSPAGLIVTIDNVFKSNVDKIRSEFSHFGKVLVCSSHGVLIP
jgi:hypothetical protein